MASIGTVYVSLDMDEATAALVAIRDLSRPGLGHSMDKLDAIYKIAHDTLQNAKAGDRPDVITVHSKEIRHA